MAQYAVLIFERETGEDLPPEVLEAHGQLGDRIAELGGRIVAGMALEPSGTATAIRGDLITDGPFIETKEALAGVFILEAQRPRPRPGAGEADADCQRRRGGPAADRVRDRA